MIKIFLILLNVVETAKSYSLSSDSEKEVEKKNGKPKCCIELDKMKQELRQIQEQIKKLTQEKEQLKKTCRKGRRGVKFIRKQIKLLHVAPREVPEDCALRVPPITSPEQPSDKEEEPEERKEEGNLFYN